MFFYSVHVELLSLCPRNKHGAAAAAAISHSSHAIPDLFLRTKKVLNAQSGDFVCLCVASGNSNRMVAPILFDAFGQDFIDKRG